MYASVVFPLPFRNSFTYSIPKEYTELVQTGVRVVVPFGKRILTGFVIEVSEATDIKEKIKSVQDVLDPLPIFDDTTLKFYEWLSEYYICSLGEALKNSVPYGLEVETKRRIVADPEYCSKLLESEKNPASIKAKILEVLCEKGTVSLSNLQKFTGRKNIYTTLRSLEIAGALSVINELETSKVHIKKLKYVTLKRPVNETHKLIPELEVSAPKQMLVLLELISKRDKEIALQDLIKKTKSSASTIASLAKKGLVTLFDKEIERKFVQVYEEDFQSISLTADQQNIVNEVSADISRGSFNAYLLHGVTGSGKTQVYIELVKKTIEQNKTAIILVPEISLTPQIASRFINNFGEIITILHSRMSLGERFDSWRKIREGKYKVVIGPRSALFAPMKDIGLIVVDEEHDSSYKQSENMPKYNGRDAAVVRARLHNAPVLLGSATPSIESKYNAESGKYTLLKLPERVDNAKLPKIELVDIRVENRKKQMENIFSKRILEEIDGRLSKKEGVIILQNRRGFATHIYCEDCGEIEQCPNCSVSMVYHISKNFIQCHYCGIIKSPPKACSRCGSISMKYFGTGTQRVEDELEFHFPKAKIERIDSDSVAGKGNLGIILNKFRKGDIDILVGTQMVSKGLDFSRVTLVGVVSAETTLWLPDFRADERTFQLLTQVAGRAGRSKIEGEVIIQTNDSNNFVLRQVLTGNYEQFYNSELELRKKGGYPPYTRLCLFEAKNKSEKRVKAAMNDLHEILKKRGGRVQIMPPSPAIIERIKGFYRYQILIKSHRNKDASGKYLRTVVLDSYIEFNQKSRYRDVKMTIDIDPQSII